MTVSSCSQHRCYILILADSKTFGSDPVFEGLWMSPELQMEQS